MYITNILVVEASHVQDELKSTPIDEILKICLILQNGDKLEHRLLNVEKPILKIPNICIYLMRDHNEKFSPNKESHL